MTPITVMRSIKKISSDYSLKKFIFYAISPLNWWSLISIRIKSHMEKKVFRSRFDKWQIVNVSYSPVGEYCFCFRPWLRDKKKKVVRQKKDVDQINVDINSSDPEVRMRLDRLGWALQLAINDPVNAWEELIKWNELRWQTGVVYNDSYSISERVCNLILLWNIESPDPFKVQGVIESIHSDCDHLMKNLEYHGETNTNNHIINNARALIIAGSFLNEDRFYEAGCYLLEIQLSQHINPDGSIREASTHYQWVITRWILEIASVYHFVDKRRFGVLEKLLENMLHVCDVMKLGEEENSYLPLIGDISPDFSPKLYGGMTSLGYCLLGYDNAHTKSDNTETGFWTHFFKGSYITKTGNWLSADKSWARLESNGWSLISHSDINVQENRPTHGHHDLFSFELAFKGTPIVVDPGRQNYVAGRDSEEAGILEEWHNSILVNSKRVGFLSRGYMPTKWLKRIRTAPNVELKEHALTVSLNSPVEVPSVLLIERELSRSEENCFLIFNRVLNKKRSSTTIKLNLHLTGKVSLINDTIELETDGGKFIFSWSGLPAPLLKNALYSVDYGVSQNCTRVVWSFVSNALEIESAIKISPSQELA